MRSPARAYEREDRLPILGQVHSHHLLRCRNLHYLSTLSPAVSSAFMSLHTMQTRPPGNIERRKERVEPVSALAASPLGAMEDYPEDAEIRLRLQVLAGEIS
jgi:hypothetical protein